MEGIDSEVCVPLFDRDRIAGVLNIESTGGVTMGAEDLRLMTNLGAQVGVAITRARLYGVVRESERRYRSLVEDVGEGIAVVDPDETFVFANPAAEAMFGVPRGTLAGRGLREFLSDEEYTRARAETERRRKGERSAFEQDIIRSDGAVRRIELTSTPHLAADGSFSGTFAVFRDITEYRALEQNLERERGRLLTLINSLPDNVYLKDVEGRFVLANRATAAFLGARDPADLVGQTEAAFLPGGLGEAMLRDDRAAIGEARSVIDREELIPSARARITGCSPRRSRCATRAGRITGLVGIARDITKRKEAEEKLLNFIDQSPEAILLADEQGAVIEYNASAERLSGIPRGEAVGALIWDLFARGSPRDGDLRPSAEPERGASARGPRHGHGLVPEPADRRHAPASRRDGTPGAAVPVPDPHDARLADRHDQPRHDGSPGATEKALRASEEHLAQAQRLEALGRLAGGVAHDFNNVLTVIQGYADLLAAALGDDSPHAPDVAEIARAARTRLRHDLAAARLQPQAGHGAARGAARRRGGGHAGDAAPDPRRGHPGRVPHRGRAGQHPRRSRPDRARHPQPRGQCPRRDAGRRDARDRDGHRHPGRRLRPRAPRGTPGRLRRARDERHGHGHRAGRPPAHLRAVLHHQETRPGHGTRPVHGLRHREAEQRLHLLLERAGAGRDLHPVFSPSVGRREWIRRRPLPPRTGSARAAAGRCSWWRTRRESGGWPARCSAARGYTMLTASDGVEALEISRGHSGAIDLLVTDVVMPRMNGPELAGRMAVLRPGIRVLYISGYAETALAHQGRLEPGVDLLQKPFDPDTLAERVRLALGRRT